MTQESLKQMKEIMGDVPVEAKVRCGQKYIAVKEITEFKPGLVIAFDKVVGEPMDVFFADTLMARGEVVVVNERYGIRISEVLK